MIARLLNAALAALLPVASLAHAQSGATPPAAGIGTGQVFGLFAGTLLVLAVIGGIAWLLKRMAPHGYGSGGVLRVIAGAAVGQRERVVVVEIGSSWLVLGVAPGSVNLLQQMPRSELPATPGTAPLATTAFAVWLKQMMEKRNGR